MRKARRAWIACLLTALCGALAHADIYEWTDAEGRVHYTQQLDRVPPAQRDAAMRAAKTPGRSDALQTYSTPAAPSSGGRASRLVRELHIPFEREGTLMRVNVRLNGSLLAPFYIDTGASGIALPPIYAERLGIRVSPDTPRVVISTANGRVSNPIVRLRSVDLGGARVEGLEATLNPSMEIGLLGGSFFNNFVYRVDAAKSVITLSPNDGMRGGLDAEAWRARFAEVRDLLGRLDAHLAGEQRLASGERADLERRRAELVAALAKLDEEADRQRVPQGWRE